MQSLLFLIQFDEITEDKLIQYNGRWLQSQEVSPYYNQELDL